MENNNIKYEIIEENFIDTEVSELLPCVEPFNGIDIFSDTSKLPESCKNELKTPYLGHDDEKLLSLFEYKEFISIDEIIIALYNVHSIEKTRTWVCSHLSSLAKKGHIQKVSGKKGIYAKNEK